MKDFSKIEDELAIKFKDKNLLKQAFVHRSFLNENPGFPLNQNERLEFLGDAVLELVVTDQLFKKYPNESEGELTSWRASLVNTQILSRIAKNLNFNNFLFLSKGEARGGKKARKFILGDTMEAVIGAIYLDQGYETAEKFIKENVMKELPKIIENGLFRDAKSRFQEIAQEKVQITPKYKVVKEWGPDHDKHFIIGIFLKDELIAQGEGSSKQEAEEEAAKKALEIKKW